MIFLFVPSSQDGPRHTHGSRSETSDSVNQPPLGLHRLVLGQMNTEANGNSEHTTGTVGSYMSVYLLLYQAKCTGPFELVKRTGNILN